MTTGNNPFAGMPAIVTGASSGIGRAVALQLLEAGALVTLVGRDAGRLQAAIADLPVVPDRYQLAACNVRDEEQVARMAEQAESRWGHVGMLVNGAGAFGVARLEETRLDMWRDILDTNLTGSFLCTRAVLPGMLRRRKGNIALISSIAGHRGFASTTAYCASKFAIVGFGRALSVEVRQQGVRVVTISPGSVDTPLWDTQSFTPIPREQMLKPEEVSSAILASFAISPTNAMDEILLYPQQQVL